MALLEQEYLADVRAKSPLQRLVHWIQQRELVRLRRAAGETYPWTDDEILRTYRFCNCRRMDDKVSQWLLRNWYKPHFNHPNMLAAVALARFVNRPESLATVTQQVFLPDGPDWADIKVQLRKVSAAGGPVFNGAYMVRGNTTKSPDKIGTVVDEYIGALMEGVAEGAVDVDTSSMEKTHTSICNVYGFGSFMAGQVVADLRWAVEGTWADRHEWAPIGPGSARGMNRLHERPLKSPLSQEQFLRELRELMAQLKDLLVPETYNRLEAHDFQNVLCETDKYIRVLEGEGKPKQGYKPERLK